MGKFSRFSRRKSNSPSKISEVAPSPVLPPSAYAVARSVADSSSSTPHACASAAKEFLRACERGEDMPADGPSLMVKLAERAAAADDPLGWGVLSEIFMSSSDAIAAPDVSRALEAAQRGAALDNDLAIFQYARIMHYNHAELDESVISGARTEAAQHLERLLARSPHHTVQYLAALMLESGHGFQQDLPRARALLEQSAAAGNADAEFELYIFDTKGWAGPQDETAALRHLQAAAALGHNRALANLGGMYATGNGVPLDEDMSVKLYTAAAERGNVRAAHALAVMYITGQGAPRDVEKGQYYLELYDRLS